MKKLTLLISLFTLLATAQTFAQTTIAAKDAAKYINQKVTICEKVAGGKFISSANITLIDLGGSHPNELLTLLIKGDDRKKFKTAPEDSLKNKTICVTGTLIDYKGKPEIIITDPEQIKVQ